MQTAEDYSDDMPELDPDVERADRITDEYYRALDAQEDADYDADVLARVRAAAAAKRITESHTERRA